tara:strand:+ start:761 stop:1015 length:255 start_codon:yes stop_codon:yes gene_type:complete
VIEIKNKDLDKILLVLKYMMDERPDLNEKLMDFYCYLGEMKNDRNDRNNLKRITIEESESINMNLDEMIWDLGMNLPSWDKPIK